MTLLLDVTMLYSCHVSFSQRRVVLRAEEVDKVLDKPVNPKLLTTTSWVSVDLRLKYCHGTMSDTCVAGTHCPPLRRRGTASKPVQVGLLCLALPILA